jgi:hypothetical protein
LSRPRRRNLPSGRSSMSSPRGGLRGAAAAGGSSSGSRQQVAAAAQRWARRARGRLARVGVQAEGGGWGRGCVLRPGGAVSPLPPPTHTQAHTAHTKAQPRPTPGPHPPAAAAALSPPPSSPTAGLPRCSSSSPPAAAAASWWRAPTLRLRAVTSSRPRAGRAPRCLPPWADVSRGPTLPRLHFSVRIVMHRVWAQISLTDKGRGCVRAHARVTRRARRERCLEGTPSGNILGEHLSPPLRPRAHPAGTHAGRHVCAAGAGRPGTCLRWKGRACGPAGPDASPPPPSSSSSPRPVRLRYDPLYMLAIRALPPRPPRPAAPAPPSPPPVVECGRHGAAPPPLEAAGQGVPAA